jgi:hypothetical protein
MHKSLQPRRRKIVLYLTHFWDDACAREVAALQQSLSENYDIAVAGFVADATNISIPIDIPVFFYTAEDLQHLGYSQLADLRPHHVIVPRFFRQYPDYEQYWTIEYDVRYTGCWAELLQDLSGSPADLLATVIQSQAEHPQWLHWNDLSTNCVVLPKSCYNKHFAPLMRLSNAALIAVDAAYKAGWTGHYEALWPTAIAASGLLIEDIGGEGSFTPDHRRGRYYTSSPFHPYLSPGSFVFRPSMLECDIPRHPPALWHPVKSAEMSQPIPTPPPSTWRDLPALQPLRRLRRRLRHGLVARQP